MCLPSFLGIGAQKSGTTFLYEMIRKHPDICTARYRKEVHFFDRYYDRGEAWYRSLFAHCGTRCRGEFTPAYLFHRDCPARIHALIPDVRLIAILRNPIDRCYSQYKFTIREANYTGSFSDFIRDRSDAVQRGLYYEQIMRYLRYFPRQNLLILLYENLIDFPNESVAQVLDFLGLDPGFAPQTRNMNTNPSEAPRLPSAYAAAKRAASFLRDQDLYWIIETAKATGLRQLFFARRQQRAIFSNPTEDDQSFLKEYYAKDVLQLSGLLGTDMQEHWGLDQSMRASEPL